MRLISFAVLGLLLVAAVPRVAAQDRVYVVGAWRTVWRAPGWYPSFATPDEQPAAPVMALTAGAGAWLARKVAVEGTITWVRGQSIPWHYNYVFGGNMDVLTIDRDVPLVGYVRIAPMAGHRISIEPVIGGGLSWHRGESSITADCGSGSRPRPCVPLTPPEQSDVQTTADWFFSFGADVALHVARRIDVVPGFRANVARRPQFLTGYDHRGPYSGGGSLPDFGVALRYCFK